MSEGKALAIVKAAQSKGALVFANIENMEAKVDLYRTEVTELVLKDSDFHNISGKFMPNKAATDRIGEACGVQFIQSACRVVAETREDSACGRRTVFRAEAQGKVRMPDGSWRSSTVDEYEFDPVLRAMLDKNITELNEKTRPVIGRTILEYTKIGRQRAATGARLRVIRQLTGMPGSFEKADVQRPMVFTRIVQNTDYILRTPEGRALATAQALGADITSLFGGSKALGAATAGLLESPADIGLEETPGDAVAEAASPLPDEPDFDDPADAPVQLGERPQETEFDRLTASLRDYLDGYAVELDVATASGRNPFKMAVAELDDLTATEETRRAMIGRIRQFLLAKGCRV